MSIIKMRSIRWAGIAFAFTLFSGCASYAPRSNHSSQPWITTWGTSAAVPPATGASFNNQTLRLIVHVSAGGDEARVKISNAFGNKALAIGAASIATQSTGAAIVAGPKQTLTFNGKGSVSIPPGALIVSDAVHLHVQPQSNLAISLFVPSETGPATGHPGANENSYVAGPGNFVLSDEATSFSTTIPSWPLVSGVEVAVKKQVKTIVTFGDSITDGYKSTIGANRRWPDYFASRLISAGKSISIVNAGISGNRLLHDSAAAQPRFGPNALSRFDRDVLAVSGATHVVTLIGINDIGMGSPTRSPEEVVSADDIIGALNQLVVRAQAHGLKIYGATLTPFRGAAYFTEEGEQKRQTVNAWIRANKHYAGILDFDKATQDPANPSQMLAKFDSGDHLHPNDAGYQAMADSIDLRLFD